MSIVPDRYLTCQYCGKFQAFTIKRGERCSVCEKSHRRDVLNVCKIQLDNATTERERDLIKARIYEIEQLIALEGIENAPDDDS